MLDKSLTALTHTATMSQQLQNKSGSSKGSPTMADRRDQQTLSLGQTRKARKVEDSNSKGSSSKKVMKYAPESRHQEPKQLLHGGALRLLKAEEEIGEFDSVGKHRFANSSSVIHQTMNDTPFKQRLTVRGVKDFQISFKEDLSEDLEEKQTPRFNSPVIEPAVSGEPVHASQKRRALASTQPDIAGADHRRVFSFGTTQEPSRDSSRFYSLSPNKRPSA